MYVLLESFSIIIYSHHSVPLVLTTWFFGKQRWTKRDQSAYSCQQKIPTAHFDEKAVQTKPSLPFLFSSLFWKYNWLIISNSPKEKVIYKLPKYLFSKWMIQNKEDSCLIVLFITIRVCSAKYYERTTTLRIPMPER